MKDSEIIARAKEILLERGWGKGSYENEDGNVCILGAIAYAYDEMVGNHLSAWEVGDEEYFDDIISLPEVLNIKDKVEKTGRRLQEDHPAFYELRLGAGGFNDLEQTEFEDVMDLLNFAEIALKEEGR